MKSLIFVSLLVVLSINCKKKEPINVYSNLFKTHEATQLEKYSKSGNWFDRVQSIDEIHIDFVKKLNEIDGFLKVPSPVTDIELFKTNTRKVNELLPDVIKKYLNDYLLGIYIANDLGGASIVGIVYDKEIPVGGFIILSSDIIEKPINEYMSEKEFSVFLSKKMIIQVTLEKDESNTIIHTLRYVLLSEFSNILGVVKKLIPDFRLEKKNFIAFSFFEDIWKSEIESIYDPKVFPFREYVQFYGEKRVNLHKKWEFIYPPLEKTEFPTLYSSVSPDTHFTDSFYSYLHCVVEKKSWTVTIKEVDGKEIYTYKNKFMHRENNQTEILKKLFNP